MEDDSQKRIQQTNHSQIFHVFSVVFAVTIVTVGFLLIQQSQVIGFLQFLLPVPVVLVSLRYSLWSGIVTVTLSTVGISLLSEYRLGVFFLFITGAVAIMLAVCFHRKFSATTVVSCIALYYIVLGIALVYMQKGLTFAAYTQNMTTVFQEQFVRIYESNDVAWQNLRSQLEALARVLGVTFPLMSALSNSIIMYVVIRSILKLWKIPVVPLGRFQDWQVSDYLVWIFVLGGMLYHIEYTRTIGINLILGLVFLYYLVGCAIITYFLKQRNTTKFLQVLAYVLLFLQIPYIFVSLGLLLTGYSDASVYLPLPAIVLVTGVGLSNVWVDFRKRAGQVKE